MAGQARTRADNTGNIFMARHGSDTEFKLAFQLNSIDHVGIHP